MLLGVFAPNAQAQVSAAPTASSQQSDSASMMSPHGLGGGMMGREGMMGGGMMGRGPRGGTPPMIMRMMFSLMDADGDGKLSIQEFQAAHERIFKTMGANKDGFVSFDEMQDFIRGGSTPASQQ
jgi:EF hand